MSTPPGEALLGEGNKIFDCRRGLGQIVTAAAVNASSDGEVNKLDPKGAFIRLAGEQQLYEAQLATRNRYDWYRPSAIGSPGELHQASVCRHQQVLRMT